MNQSSTDRTETIGPGPGPIAFAVLLTSIVGVVVFFVGIEWAQGAYRQEHGLGQVVDPGVFFDSMKPAPVTLSMLGMGTVLWLIAVPVSYSVLVHPLIGRAVVTIVRFLAQRVDSLYGLTDDDSLGQWTPGPSVIAGAAWPITAIAIPVLVIAIVIGHIYRALWSG